MAGSPSTTKRTTADLFHALCAVPAIVHALCADATAAARVAQLDRRARDAMASYDADPEECAARAAPTPAERADMFAHLVGWARSLTASERAKGVEIARFWTLNAVDQRNGRFHAGSDDSEHHIDPHTGVVVCRTDQRSRCGGDDEAIDMIEGLHVQVKPYAIRAPKARVAGKLSGVHVADYVDACAAEESRRSHTTTDVLIHPLLLRRAWSKRVHCARWRDGGGADHALTFAAMRYFDEPRDAVEWSLTTGARLAFAARPSSSPTPETIRELALTFDDVARFVRRSCDRTLARLEPGEGTNGSEWLTVSRADLRWIHFFWQCRRYATDAAAPERAPSGSFTGKIRSSHAAHEEAEVHVAGLVERGRRGATLRRRDIADQLRAMHVPDADGGAGAASHVWAPAASIVDSRTATALYGARRRAPPVADRVAVLLSIISQLGVERDAFSRANLSTAALNCAKLAATALKHLMSLEPWPHGDQPAANEADRSAPKTEPVTGLAHSSVR